MKLQRSIRPALFVCASLVASLGCIDPPEPSKQAAPEAPAAKVEPPAPVGPVTAETDQGLKPTTEPMTAEELRLIAADPKTLTPEESILRAHALRKKIMLNPDSEAAKALNEARAAVLTGQVDPKANPEGEASEDKGLILQAPPHLMKPPADKEPTP